jgi:hypothetical protein
MSGIETVTVTTEGGSVTASGEDFERTVHSLVDKRLGGKPLAPPSEQDFGESDFLEGLNLTPIGDDLITRHFDELENFTIEFLWKKRGGKVRGQPRFGGAQQPTGLLGYFCTADFVIWLAADTVRDAHWTSNEIEAALFHELCECGADDDGNPKLVWYDFSGFTREVEQYGAWTSHLKDMANVVQLALFDKASGNG